MKFAFRPCLLAALCAATASPTASGSGPAPLPIADIHLHYKWNQAESLNPQEALQRLRANHVVLGVVIGTPPERALDLSALAPDTVRAWYGPYRTPRDWSRWYRDESLPVRARAALAGGRYQGIGELHLIGGFAPRSEHAGIAALFEVAGEFSVPVLAHVEFGRADYVIGLCSAHARTRILLAHAGAPMSVAQVARALEACPNLFVELSARDPWRYGSSPIADEQGRLLPAWRELVLNHADRFMVGSDPVWPVDQLDAWDSVDTGWDRIGDFLDFHRGWLADTPEPARSDIASRNALRLFGLGP